MVCSWRWPFAVVLMACGALVTALIRRRDHLGVRARGGAFCDDAAEHVDWLKVQGVARLRLLHAARHALRTGEMSIGA